MLAGNLEKAPELNRIGDLFADGLKFIVIGFVYAIPPMIIAILAVVIFNFWGLF